MPKPMSEQRKKSRVAALSVASNSVLVVFKLIVGILIGSVSVLSEANAGCNHNSDAEQLCREFD